MRILYHMPALNTINAGRTYYYGYKHAFEDLKHDFMTLSSDDCQKEIFDKFEPQIFITSLAPLNLKYLDINLLKIQKKKGLKVFINAPFWNSPFPKLRVNETPSLSKNKDLIKLIKKGWLGDVYYNVCEPGDQRMHGFEKETGYKLHTILLAADMTQMETSYNSSFSSDIAFIGTFLPGRREYMRKYIFPLKKKYNIKLYCQDLTQFDKSLNFLMKVGQFFNIPYLKSFKKNNVTFEEEKQILRSATISLNIHEDYQKKYGRDFNDRTFKIPLFGGFEITDNVASIKKYLKNGKEIIIAENGEDMLEKIDYYLHNPQKRLPIIEAGRKKVLKEHTYHNRVEQIIGIYNSIR